MRLTQIRRRAALELAPLGLAWSPPGERPTTMFAVSKVVVYFNNRRTVVTLRQNNRIVEK